MKELEVEIGPDGIIRAMYEDGIEELLGASITRVKRASRVEWESGGWTVRAEHAPELAARILLVNSQFRVLPTKDGELCIFTTRESALDWEKEHFWALLPPKEK